MSRPLPPADVIDVEGVPTMTVTAALRACHGRVMPERFCAEKGSVMGADVKNPRRVTAQVRRGGSEDFVAQGTG